MKRDMELIREILIKVENFEIHQPQEIEIEGYSSQQINYHIKMLAQIGFIKAHDFSSFDGELWLPKELTWNGHEFIDSIRNDNVWQKIKEKLGSDVSTLPLTVVSQVAIEAAKAWALTKLGLNTK